LSQGAPPGGASRRSNIYSCIYHIFMDTHMYPGSCERHQDQEPCEREDTSQNRKLTQRHRCAQTHVACGRSYASSRKWTCSVGGCIESSPLARRKLSPWCQWQYRGILRRHHRIRSRSRVAWSCRTTYAPIKRITSTFTARAQKTRSSELCQKY